jgi:hypothetical protein
MNIIYIANYPYKSDPTTTTYPIRYVLDGRLEAHVSILRLTTIPMPMRGIKATLRERAPKVAEKKSATVSRSPFATMSAIDCLKWGLLYNRNVIKGWLRAHLIKEKVVDDNKEDIQKRFWSDYKAQELFMQGMQACMGDDFDPRISKQKREADGNFGHNKNGVPQNILTVKYLFHAYDISYTTFKRMKKADNELPKAKAPHSTKGKSVFDSKAFAKAWYSPYRIYVRQKYLEWRETEVGQNADKNRKRVSCLSQTITLLTQTLTLTLTV